MIRANIVPALGNVRIDKLGPAQRDLYFASLANSGLSLLTVRKSHAMLSAALNQAYKWGWIDRKPAERASPPGIHQKEIIAPTAEQIRLILDACDGSNPDLGSLMYMALTTACRRGELCGLRWGDVDLDKATLVVARSISDASGEVIVKGTKTHQTRRIALDPSTVEVLRRQRARSEERAQMAGVELASVAYVWSQSLDASVPYRPDRVTAAFVGLRNRLGLRHLTFYGLRHFAATALAASGLGVRTNRRPARARQSECHPAELRPLSRRCRPRGRHRPRPGRCGTRTASGDRTFGHGGCRRPPPRTTTSDTLAARRSSRRRPLLHPARRIERKALSPSFVALHNAGSVLSERPCRPDRPRHYAAHDRQKLAGDFHPGRPTEWV